MSTSVLVDPEISTQADGAQSSQVPMPLLEDPYEAIRQTYLVEMDTKLKPFKDLVETKTFESPHTVASPTLLPDSTPLHSRCTSELVRDEEEYEEKEEDKEGFGSVLDPERPERVSALRQPTLTTWIDLEGGRTCIDILTYPSPAPPV
nr:hypothetical protein [Tanacetum cinerariifolium]